jgi:antirestriction protein ArdC
MSKASPPSFAKLLDDAVSQPGVLSSAYQAFWNYSVSNSLLAIFECMRRKIEIGPLNTFRGWRKLGRQVRKGEKAITLCMPVTWKQKEKTYRDPGDETTNGDEIVSLRRRFIFRPFWFVIAQTDGEPYTPLSIPDWDEERVLYELHIDRVPFVHPDGNCQGFAQGRQVAISPIAYLPHRTLLHEMAHVLLGHTAELLGLTDRDERTPKDVREVEAEAVAYLCCQSLKLPGEEFSRGYLQHWLGSKRIDERSAHKIFHVADQILKAGRPEPAEASISENAA